MANDINFTRISRRDLLDKKEIIKSAVENSSVGIVDKNVDRSDIVDVTDKIFFNEVMFAFENNPSANSCFCNDLKDRTDSDFSKSYNVQIDPLNTCIRLVDSKAYGEYYTREIFSNEKADSTMNKFFLIVDENVPRSSETRYYLVTDKDEVFPIKANNKEPLVIRAKENEPKSVRIKAYIKQGAGEIQVKIKGIALLYEDDYISRQVDIFRPDFDREVITTPDEGIVILHRDPLSGDALCRVETSKDNTILNYDFNGTLSYLELRDVKDNKMLSKTEMIYEDYVNSEGETEKVLTKIRTKNATAIKEK